LIIIIFCLQVGYLIAQDNSFNPISPRYETISLAVEGFSWINNDLAVDTCVAVADSLWIRQTGDPSNLLVAVDGPHGSGRYWTVTVAVKKTGAEGLPRGICLETSTIGWRTLQYFNQLPLPWVGDRNKNGKPEFILWDSFPLNDEPTMAEFGLIGWVYELDHEGNLILNLPLTYAIISEIIDAYRKPLDNTNVRFQKRRNEIARLLEAYARDE